VRAAFTRLLEVESRTSQRRFDPMSYTEPNCLFILLSVYCAGSASRYSASTTPKSCLLAALPRQEYHRVAQYLEPVSLIFGEVLYEPGGRIRHAYFPYSGVISLLTVVGPGKAAEVGIVGNEGLVGGSAALGIDVSHLRAVVQGAGMAARITSSRLRKAFETNDSWHRVLFRFTHALMNQTAQTAACNRFHTVEARLARWLLATRDRVHSQQFHLTHQFLSLILGVRRVGVYGSSRQTSGTWTDYLQPREYPAARSKGSRSRHLRVLWGGQRDVPYLSELDA